jgi:hypothetical protein
MIARRLNLSTCHGNSLKLNHIKHNEVLNQSQIAVKKMLNDIIRENIPAKCFEL